MDGGDLVAVPVDRSLEQPPNKANAAHEGIKAITFDKALTAYTKHQIVAHERIAAKETEKWMRFGFATLLTKNVQITTSEIVKLLEAKRDHGHAPASNRLCAHIKTFFKYCRKRHHVVIDPALDIEKPWQPRREKLSRQRSWFKGDAADDVLRALWRHADKIGGDRGSFFKLLMITMKRCSAVANMRWQDIDAQWNWTPPYRSDIKKNNPLVLPRLAQRILSPRQQTGKVLQERVQLHGWQGQGCA